MPMTSPESAKKSAAPLRVASLFAVLTLWAAVMVSWPRVLASVSPGWAVALSYARASRSDDRMDRLHLFCCGAEHSDRGSLCSCCAADVREPLSGFDPWGSHWRTTSIWIGETECILEYSTGPNLVDEHGGGDDVLVTDGSLEKVAPRAMLAILGMVDEAFAALCFAVAWVFVVRRVPTHEVRLHPRRIRSRHLVRRLALFAGVAVAVCVLLGRAYSHRWLRGLLRDYAGFWLIPVEVAAVGSVCLLLAVFLTAVLLWRPAEHD